MPANAVLLAGQASRLMRREVTLGRAPYGRRRKIAEGLVGELLVVFVVLLAGRCTLGSSGL